MSSKKHGKKLITDKNTDYLFDYFMMEDKINEQLRGQLDEEIAKKLENHQPKLDSRVMTDKNTKVSFSSEEQQELPTISPNSEDNFRPNVEFNDDDGDGDDGQDYNDIAQNFVRSPYGQKINPIPPIYQTQHIPKSDNKPKEVISERPILGEKLVADVQKYIETPEERRARAREAYSKLQDLVEKYQIKLTRPFSIDDDPDEMEAEYSMHKERRNKNNQVKFYKQILLNIVCGAEFLNEKYNPFEFKLKDWSKQVASDMDDYTEVLEEIYEKYKDKGGKMAPEIRLLFMIIMSGVTFHLSQALFGSGGLGDTIKSNPNILNQLLGGLMKGGGANLLGGGNNDEPMEAKQAMPTNKNLLAAIRKHQNKTSTDTKTENKSENKSEVNHTTTDNNSDAAQKLSIAKESLAIERERRLLAEQQAAHENQLRKRDEIFMAEIEKLKNQLNNKNTSISQQSVSQAPTQEITNYPNNYTNNYPNNYPNGYQNNYQNDLENGSVNQVLSDASRKPRFRENQMSPNNQYPKPTPINFQQPSDNNLNMFASDNKESFRSDYKSKLSSTKKPNKKISLDEILDSLGNSSDVDLDDVIETSSKKRNRNTNSVMKPITSSRKPRNNSVTKSVSKKRGSDTGSDLLSTTKRNNNILKL